MHTNHIIMSYRDCPQTPLPVAPVTPPHIIIAISNNSY